MKSFYPVPTRMLSNGEFNPGPRSRGQRRVEKATAALADRIGNELGLSRREFLRSLCGMAAAFLAMNQVYGPFFRVSEAEAADPDKAIERAGRLSKQFVFDDQVHFVHDDFQFKGLLDLKSPLTCRGISGLRR